MLNIINQTKDNLKNKLLNYHKKVNWWVFCFVFCFTIGAWLDINGLWCELPIMVAELPEGWKLPSILSAATQLAQIGPVIFLVGRYFSPKIFSYVNVIYVILGIGAISCLLLSFFWKKTAFVFGEEHSVGLISLNFCLALLDGTSSVTFLPYIGGNFIKEYIIPNYIGESLAALIPSILSLIQGLGQDPGCHNVTDISLNTTSLVPKNIIPTYSVSVYFIFMFILLCISTTSFSFLNFSKTAIKERKKDKKKKNRTISEKSELEFQNSPETSINSQTNLTNGHDETNVVVVSVANHRKEKIILLSYIFWLSFICYGVLPGLQSYSTLPYGNDVFNYAVNLSFVFLPFSIILSIWSYETSVLRISIEYAIATGFAIYIVVLSIMSPCPPLLGSWFGSFLSIISWILTQTMYMRIRCLIAARLERFGQNTLLILGTLTMTGQIFGGLIIFIIVNIYNLLKDKPQCVSDFKLYCY